METAELNGTQAARWVWDSLWSTRRHARMNIIDVALLEDGAAAASPTHTGMRWLFTAKDGRVMKKSSHNSNLGALKQAFLSRVLLRRGSSSAADATRATDIGGDSRSRRDGSSSNSATEGVFATALRSSGESVPLDEAGWAALIVQESGRGKGAVAVTALAPPGCDPATENSRRGGPTQQRYFCEYKANPYSRSSSSSSSKNGTNVAEGDLSRASTKPIQAALTTYVLVSRGLLRDSPRVIEESRQHHDGDKNKLNAPRASTALSDERLVSRVKDINREVEAKLRRVVQWVQEVRRVHVLSIAATFIVVPSSDRGAGTPGVWLEHALHARIVSKNGEASIALGAMEPAPYADPRGMIPPSTQLPPGTGRAPFTLTSENSQPGPIPLVPTHQNQGRGSAAREAHLTEAASSPPEETLSVADTTIPTASGSRSPASPAPVQSATTPSSPGPLGAKVQQQSTAEMLSAAADAMLLSADPPSATTTTAASPLQVASRHRHLGDGGPGGVKRSIASTAAPGRHRDGRRYLLIGAESEEAAAATAASASNYARPLRERCSGDFCAYRNCSGGVRPGPSECPPPEASAPESREGGRVGGAESPAAEVNWTSIGVSDDRRSGAALLEFTEKQQQQQLTSSPRASSEGDPKTGTEVLFSLTFKSVGLARAEARQGLDVYWGEALRRCWREGNGRGARSMEELSPALVYREVAVCRACYDVYRRLDKLRGRGGGCTADAAGYRASSSSSSSSLPLPASKGRRDSLAGIDATASSGRRAAAAEAGAATLREEVGEMLKDVDAKAGKLGVEAGIPWRRRLSKSKGTAGGRVDQSRLVDKLSQPRKQQVHHPPKEERHTLPRDDHTTHRPTLKRQVKSQGDIPDSVDDAGDRRHHPQRRTSAPVSGGGGFPSLPRARRRRLEPAAAVRGAAWQRTTLPRGRKSAWRPLDDEDGEGTVASGHDANPFGRYLEGGSGGGGGGGGGRSRETICAIEAMLEEGGGDSYLPARARDLPEALAVLGTPKPAPSSKDKVRGSVARKKLRHRGAGKKSGEDPGRKINGHSTGGGGSDRTTRDALEASTENGWTGISRNDPGPNAGDGEGVVGKTPSGWPSAKPERAEERFLHPWQRALEANKRAVNVRTGGQHEAALLEEQRCRREARRAAAESKDCRRAGRRVAARLGRQYGRRGSRHRSGKSRVHGKGDRKMAPDRTERSENLARSNGQGHEVSSRDGEVGFHRRGGDEDDDDFLRQLRDALGWARKTLEALVKRLKDRGIAVESARAAAASGGGGLGGAAKDWEIVRVLNKLRRRVAAFEDEGISLGVNKATAAEEGVAGAAEARSKCEAACESFEADFCRLIDELTATAKGPPSHPHLQLRSTSVTHRASESSGGVPPDPGGAAASDAASRTTFRSLSFGLCSSCSVLPVARRCLDCDGDDRDRCSSCFVREHRDADRQRHRFLRISGCGREGGGTVAPPPRGAATVEKGAVQEDSSGGGVRCSRCGDLAAARRCRDCRVDMCAACHFLAHRSPSRRSHVTEFVGETAVSMQEALHSRNRGTVAGSAAARGRQDDGGKVAAKEIGASCSSSPFSSPSTPQAFRNVGDSGSDRVDAGSREAREERGGESPVPGEAPFGKGAAQSLALVRRTIDAPAVPPPGPSQSLGGSGSGFCGPTGYLDDVGGESEHASRDDVQPVDEDPSAEVDVGGSTPLTDVDDGVHPIFEPPGDDIVEEEAGNPDGDGSPYKVIHRDGAGRYGNGRWNGWEEGQGRDERGNGGVEIPEEITRGDCEHYPSGTATHNTNIKDGGRSRDVFRPGAGGRGEGADMAEDMFGGLEGIKEEEGLEGEETDTSSEEGSDDDDDDDDDEGMMWSPVNIAKVVVPDTASDGEEAEIYSPPFTSRAARTPDELDDIPATPMEDGEGRGKSQAAQTREATTPKMAETPGPDEVTVNGAVGRREQGTSSPPPPPPATPKGEAATVDLDFALGSRKGNEQREGYGGGGGDASPERTLLLQAGTPKDKAAERGQDGKSTPPPPGAEIMPRVDGPERTDHQETVESGRPSP